MIDGQGAKLARALHGLAYDAVHDEIIAPNPFAEAILFFLGGTKGEEPPIRIIQGPHTQLDGGPDWNTPDVIVYDPVHEEVYTRVRRFGRGTILVFPRSGNGDVSPLRVLRGPHTLFDGIGKMGVDGKNNILVVGNSFGEPPGFMIFDRTAAGDAAPRAVISGPKTRLIGMIHQIQMDPERRQFIAAIAKPRTHNVGPGWTWGKENGFIGVWSYDDKGDVAPKAIIGGPKTRLLDPQGLEINLKETEVYVADFQGNALLTFKALHIFGQPILKH